MKECRFTIESNEPVTPGVNRLALSGDVSAITAPGQFVDLKLEGCFLRRPFSVCEAENGKLVILYRRVGKGTEKLATMQPGQTLDVLTGLGNGFDLSTAGEHPLLIGGGTGASPLYMLAGALRQAGKEVSVVLGFSTAAEVLLESEFRGLGCDVTVTTADGSRGTAGFVTDALPEGCSYFYSCGPEAMFQAIDRLVSIPGEFSFEARMGCGFGACMGCTCRTRSGFKRICRDGPVLKREEVLWED